MRKEMALAICSFVTVIWPPGWVCLAAAIATLLLAWLVITEPLENWISAKFEQLARQQNDDRTNA